MLPTPLSHYGLAGPGGYPSNIVTAYGADAQQLRPGAMIRFNDWRLRHKPLRLAQCVTVVTSGDVATARIRPSLGLIVEDGEVIAADGW